MSVVTSSVTQTDPSCSESYPLGENEYADARILIVDDEPLNIEVVREYLGMEGYRQVQATTDPVEALSTLDANDYDLVMLDIQMPLVNGFEILQTIRESKKFKTLPVVILTASTDDETRLQALQLGATDFLAKPVNQFELTARVRNLLSVKTHQDQLKVYSQELEQRVRQRTAELEASRREVIHCLARASEFRDDDTGNHVLRVGRYARLIAAELGMDEDYLELIEPAAQLHDVGKIGIPDSILLKPGKLTEDEFEYMQRHCGFGKRIISPLNIEGSVAVRRHAEIGSRIMDSASSPVLEMAKRIALTHHEKYDGSGYPLGLAGEDIPLEGRITAVADVFDALSSKRPYKPAFPMEKCFAILKQDRGTHFDPDCIDAFFRCRQQIIEAQLSFADAE